MSKKKKNILIIIVVLAALAGSFAGAYSYFSQPYAPAGKVKKTVPNESLDMGELIVNLSGSSHYLRTKVVIEYPRDKWLAAELQKKRHTVADAIITALRSKTYTEVSAAESAGALKTVLLRKSTAILSQVRYQGYFSLTS